MKIMVVDDEPLINQYIVQCIRSADPESEIVGTVTSGQNALRRLAETPADLVFADITMPKMDGIALLREIKARYPDTGVIMLTCHDDFAYARAAMQQRADNYILKNEVSAQLLRGVLEQVKARRKEHIAQGVVRQLSRDQFLRRLAEQDASLPPVREGDLRARHIYLNDAAFLVAAFSDSAQNAALMRDCLADGFENPLLYAHSEQEMFLLVNLRRDGPAGDAAADWFRARAYPGGPVGCSRVHHHLEKLPDAFREAIQDREAAFYEAPAADFTCAPGFEQAEGYLMRAAIQMGERDFRAGCAEIEQLLAYAGTGHVRAAFLQESLLQMLTGVCQKNGIDLGETDADIRDSRTFGALCAAVRGVLELLRGQDRRYSDPIRKALDYVALHYTEDISLGMVANVVYLNRDYLSRQFKKEVGVNFSEYLMRLRMKQARRLLETTNLRVSDVALHVGISNMSYFSTVFHKSFGCKPNEVRKQKQEDALSKS